MPTVTVSELVDRAKAISDMRDNFVSPTVWEYWASQERLSLDLFLARSGWTLPLSTFDIEVDGTENGAYAVNPDNGVMCIVAVHQVDGTRVRPLRHENAVEFIRSTDGPTGHSATYRVQWTGDNLTLNLSRTPTSGETYRVTYIAHPLKLTLTDPSTYATVTFAASDAANKFVATALTLGSAGNGTVVTLVDTDLAPALTTDTLAAVTARFDDGTSTWAQMYTALNTSEFIEVTTEIATGTMIATDVGTGTTAGGLDPVDFGVALSVAYPMGWEERIVLGMARRALIKEESSTSAIDSEIALWESRIEEACWSRVLSEAPSVRNTDYRHYGWSDRYVLPPYTSWTWI